MPRETFVYRNGSLVPKHEAAPLFNPTVSDLPSPTVISDGMTALLHHATGQMIDSKSKFRQTTKDAGCVEVGTSEIPKPERRSDKSLRDDVGKAYQMVRDGYKPAPQVVAGVKGGGWE